MKPEQFEMAVEEYKRIYKDEHGIELGDKEAVQKTQELLHLFDCLIGAKEV